LLLAGSIADVVGSRPINLAGCFLQGLFIIACGFARNAIEFILFRALQGIAVSMCLPTSTAIVANAVPSGRGRNLAFSCLGLVQPLGFSLGLVLEGVLLNSVGWRIGYYLSGGATLVLFLVGIWALPPDRMADGLITEGSMLKRLKTEIDWVGAMIAFTCLALFSYVFAWVLSMSRSAGNANKWTGS
jgi:MFS family permease